MRARDFRLEYERSKTVANWAEKLGEVVQIRGHDNWANRQFAYHGESIEETGTMMIGWFERSDPSGGKFVPMMIRCYLDGSMKRAEDAPKAKTAIETYMKFRNRIKIDLRTIRFDDFLDEMEEVSMQLSNTEMGKAEEQGFYERGEAVLVHDDADVKIVIPKDMGASCFFGKNTRWCTAARDKNDNLFYDYSSRGPLYIILFKRENKRWQFHFEDCQFMNERDEPLSQDSIREFLETPVGERVFLQKFREQLYKGDIEEVIECIPHLTVHDINCLLGLEENEDGYDVVRVPIAMGLLQWLFVDGRENIIGETREVLDEWKLVCLKRSGQTIGFLPQTEINCLRAVEACASALYDVSDWKIERAPDIDRIISKYGSVEGFIRYLARFSATRHRETLSVMQNARARLRVDRDDDKAVLETLAVAFCGPLPKLMIAGSIAATFSRAGQAEQEKSKNMSLRQLSGRQEELLKKYDLPPLDKTFF